MKNNDMRGLLGIMRNHKFLIKEDDNQPLDKNELQSNIDNENDKNEILDIINSIKLYKIFVENIEMTDDENKMVIITSKYTDNNYSYRINMKISTDRQSSVIDIECPRPLSFDANSESTLFDFYSVLYNKFKNELFEKCSSMLTTY